MSDSTPAIAVVGAGAVGCYFGGMLARSGVPVTLIGRAAHMEAIARDGLHLDTLHFHDRVAIRATTSVAEGVRGAGLILFTVKTVATESAAREIAPHLAPDAVIFSLQNGVDNPERIQSASGHAAVPIVVYVAAEMTAPGRVTHTGRGDLILPPAGAPYAAMFEAAGIPCRIAPDIAPELWTKMVMNCAYNAISALTRAQYGRMIEFPPVRSLMQHAVAETVAVARAAGVDLREPDMLEATWKLGAKMSAATSSTAQDIARARLTEIDSLNGYIARRGAALGIPTPVNDSLVALVKLLEESAVNRRSG